jgi:O-succinylbenzoic acid--CoA ligase
MAQPNKPHFSHPPASNIFLSLKENSYTYRDLYTFTRSLRSQLPADEHPLLVFTENSAETVFVIASSFLIEKPVIPVTPDIENRRLQEICDKLSTSAFFSSKPREESCLTELTKIEADFNQNDHEDHSGQDFETEGSFLHPDVYAGFFHTSGSTSSPKIVPIKRRQFFSAAQASKQNFKPTKNRFWLLCLPMNHIGGISVIIRSLLYHSAIYLVPGFEEKNIRSLLNNNKQFEAASMVPTMLERLLEDSFFRVQYNFKALLLGGGPISPELISKSLTRGIPIVTSYGMTETCAQIAANPMLRSGGMYIPKKSVGKVFEPNEIEIRDDNGNALPYLESGHIWLRGPQVFDGYYDTELNRSVFDSDGWFNTGDFGHINRKKHLFVESRRTDLIISGGENISPVEVEDALKKLDNVNDAAVVGVPDREWGQKAVAFIRTENQQAADPDGLRTQLKGVLQSFKIPKEFVDIHEIPRTLTGKIRRKELRDRYLKK